MCKIMKTPTLGAIMIVKNEEKNLGGILSDIQGVVDEICIVDTGSSDGTVSLAESYGARVGHFPWIDDFAAARNHSIQLASSDYLLWLDADDRIDESDLEVLVKLKTRLRHQKDRAYMLKILSRSEDMPDTISYQTRIIPNRDGVRFEGRVHEQILPSLKKCSIRVESIDMTIRHIGYHDAEARQEKARRNLDILMKEFREGKDTATQCFFIAMACIGMQDYERCLEYISLARQKRSDEDWYHFSYTVSVDCLIRLNRIQESRREISSGIAAFPESPLLHYFLGTVCMSEGDYSEAASAFKKASALKPLIDSYPLPPDLQTNSLLQQGKALEKLGRTEKAIHVYEEGLKSCRDPKALHHALGIALLQAGNVDEAIDHLTRAQNMSVSVDASLWLSLAQIHLHRKNHDKAHVLYLEILHENPTNLHALACILTTSIFLDDMDTFLSALEQLMLTLDIPIPEAAIDSLAECADLCTMVARQLKERGERVTARYLAETALILNASCSDAHLLLADLFSAQGDTARMIESLEVALKSGADGHEILERIEKATSTGNTA